MNLLRGLLHWLFTWLVVLLILFEEWGWEPLERLAARLGRLPVFDWLEREVVALPPYGALAVLGVPALALVPIKLLAVFAIAEGYPLLGVGIIVVAKVVGTALLARLFQLTQPALLRLAWFARWYVRWIRWKHAVVAQVRISPAWLAGRRMKRRARVRALRLWRRWVLR